VTCLGVSRGYNSNCAQLLVGGYQSYLVLDENYEISKRIELEHEGSINSLVGLRDGSSVISCSTDSKLIISNFCDYFPLKKVFDHRDSLYCLEMSDSQDVLATGGKDKTIKIWRTNFHEQEFRNGCFDSIKLDLSLEAAHSTDITALKLSSRNSSVLISASATGEIKLWDISEGVLVRTFKDHSGLVYKIIIIDKQGSETKNLFTKKRSTCSNNKKSTARKVNSGAKPGALSSQPLDEFLFITSAFDGSYKLWETEKQQPVCELKGRNRMDCFPYGGCLLFKSEHTENQLLMVTSGNKMDSDLNLWVIK
jgi:WD40 repeat protein